MKVELIVLIRRVEVSITALSSFKEVTKFVDFRIIVTFQEIWLYRLSSSVPHDISVR